MRSNTVRVFMLLSLMVMVATIAVDAQAARRSSLGGNQFINDADDMYAFPQLLLKYRNLVMFDLFPGSGNSGSGSVTFGDEKVWQCNTGRGDFLNNTSYWAAGGFDRMSGFSFGANGLPGSNGPGDAVEWWDVGFATVMGENPWGFNISYAKDSDKIEPDGLDPIEDTKTSMISLQVGTTMSGVELAAEVGFGSYKDELPSLDPSDQNDYDYFNFALLGRGDLEGGGQNWRWVAAFANGSSEPKREDAVKLSSTGFRGSFGPVWGSPGAWEVAAAMSFEYVKNEDFGDNIETKGTETYTAFPSYNFAMEYYLNKWFVMRGGVQSHNATDKFELEDPDGDGPEIGGESSERNYDFMWTAGVGIDKGMWGLDLALEEDDLHSGYFPLNGNVSNDPIALMTAWLNW